MAKVIVRGGGGKRQRRESKQVAERLGAKAVPL